MLNCPPPYLKNIGYTGNLWKITFFHYSVQVSQALNSKARIKYAQLSSFIQFAQFYNLNLEFCFQWRSAVYIYTPALGKEACRYTE